MMATATYRTVAPRRRLRYRVALPMLVTFGLVEALCLSLFALVLAADPYDIYGWGVRPELKAGDIPRDRVVDWIDVAAKKPGITTFLVGSSVTLTYAPDEIAALLGDKGGVYNLSYGGPRPRDRDIVLERLARNSRAERIIITFDWMYILDPTVTREAFPAFLYDEDVVNDLRMVNLTAIRRTLEVIGGNRTYGDGSGAGRYARFLERRYRQFQQDAQMAMLARLVETYRPTIGAPSGKTCADFRAVGEQLVPRVRAFAAEGVKMDILIPIVSYASYYTNISETSVTRLDEEMIARRCLVEAVGDLPNVRVFAFDDDPSIAGDLGNYRDVNHIHGPDLSRRFISAIATGDGALTGANIGDYERSVRSAVEHYRVRNSRLSIDDGAAIEGGGSDPVGDAGRPG